MARTLLGALLNKTPIPLAPRTSGRGMLGTFASPRGQEAQLRAMSATGTLFAIIAVTSNAVARVDWKLWRKSKSGLKEDRTEVTSHAALDLWNKPNPFMPRQEFVETFQQHIDLTGEGWWIIGRNPMAKLPLEMWPVRPDRMDPIPHPEEFLTGYIYRGPSGEQVPLERDQVIQLRLPNPLDPYRGLSPVLSVMPDLDTTRYAAEWIRAFFLNSAEPGGIVELPSHLGDGEWNEMLARWDEQHRGVANSHRVAFLEHGQWKDRKYTQKDMQFVELRGATRASIREAYGIPKFAVGDLEDVNRATALAAKAWFAEQLTIPRLERIKAALNHDLLPLYGATSTGLEFDYCDPVPPDPETTVADRDSRVTAAVALIEAGAYGPAAVDAFGLPEIQFGQPGADPNRELLINLAKGAPSNAPWLLEMLGFELPESLRGSQSLTAREQAEIVQKLYLGVGTLLTWEEARRVLAAAGLDVDPSVPQPSPPAGRGVAGTAPLEARGLSVFSLTRTDQPALDAAVVEDNPDEPEVENAMRWVARENIDSDSCQPCRDNDGHLYRNRADAYADYPGGAGYVRCEGGANCRGKVVKRRKGDDGE